MHNEKSSEVEQILEKLSGIIGTPRSVALESETCVMCSGDASTFKDAASKKEYALSGMCQKCQDKFFE